MNTSRSFNTGLQKNIRCVLAEKWPQIPLGNSQRDRKGFKLPIAEPPLKELLGKLEENLTKTKCMRRSPENWRFRCVCNVDAANKGEKLLEKYFAIRLESAGDWANQVPTCSGYSDGKDGKRSIDLVHHDGKGGFKFIELKTTANTPSYAAVEILLYGLTYLLARKRGAVRADTAPQLLNATAIHLVVLAPEEFYEGYPSQTLPELQKILDSALREFAPNVVPGLSMSFAFETLGPGFAARKTSYTHDEIRKMSDGIKPLFRI